VQPRTPCCSMQWERHWFPPPTRHGVLRSSELPQMKICRSFRFKILSSLITITPKSKHSHQHYSKRPINAANRQSQLIQNFYITETHFTLPTNFGYCSNNRTETLWMVRLVAFLTQHNLGILFRLPAHLAHTTIRALPSSTHTWIWTHKHITIIWTAFIFSECFK
jgi:hypothetical protein